MSKIIKLIILFLCVGFSLIACSKPKTADEKPDVEEKSKDTTDTKEQTNVSKIINEESIESSKITIEFKKGLKDETLAIDTQDTYNYENLSINVKEYTLLLFCTDPVYGISYYVNYGEDFYIYRIKDGKSELAVEMPAKRLFCNEGKLYFILESYELFTFKGMKDGNILCYDPVSGDVSIICDVNADYMSVYEDGIYFKTIESITKVDDNNDLVEQRFFYYSFTTKKIDEINDNFKTTIKWKDYFITIDKKDGYPGFAALKLETLDKSKSKELADNETGLLSGISPEENKPFLIIHELYTDGINLYGICSLGSKTSGSLKRLVIGDIPNGFIRNTEKDGVIYEINRLMYQALPIGEE